MKQELKEKRIEREGEDIEHLSLKDYDLDFLVSHPRDDTFRIKTIDSKKLEKYIIVDGKKKYLYKMSAVSDSFFKARIYSIKKKLVIRRTKEILFLK